MTKEAAMKETYERTRLAVTEFDCEDVIMTSSLTTPENRIKVIQDQQVVEL